MKKGTPAKTPAERAAASPKSAKLAIAAYCYHGCHNERERNSHRTKWAIRTCTDVACPLWPHRGFQQPTSRN